MAEGKIYKASTVILCSEEGKVLLTKRKESLKFLGGFHVYPGGRVDEKDYDREILERIPSSLIDEIKKDWFPADPKGVAAHIVAGVREVFEETGIMLLEGEFNNLGGEREKILRGEINFKELIVKLDLIFSDNITYLEHWITPPVFPVRFDTRFFVTGVQKNYEIQPNPDEIENYIWIAPEEALELYEKQAIMLMPPTFYTLKKVPDRCR